MFPQIFAWGISVASITLWMVPWMKTYSATHGQLTATSMCMLLATGWLSPLGAYLAERIRVRNLLATGLLTISVSYLVLSRATAMWQIMLLYALPIAFSLVLTSAMMGQILAVKLFHPKPGLAIGIVSLGVSLGGIIAPQFITKLLTVYPWQTTLVYLAVTGAVLGPLMLVIIPQLSTSPQTHQHRVQAPARLSIKAILTDRVFIGAVMIVMTLNILFNAVFYNLGPYLQETGAPIAKTASILSVSSVPGFIGTMVFAPLADRIDYRVIMLFALVVVGSGVVAIAGGAGVDTLIIIVPIMTLAVGGLYSLMPVIMAQRFGRDSFERANGLSLPFTFLGGVGAFVAGLGRDELGSYPHTFAVMLSLMLVPAIGLLLLAGSRSGQKSAVAGNS